MAEGGSADRPSGRGRTTPEKGQRLPQLFAAIAAGIALSALVGWNTHTRFLAGQWGANIPMAPSTAIAFLLLTGALFSYARWPARHLSRRFATACSSLVLLLALLVLGQLITGVDTGMERALSRTNELLGQAPLGRMSPLTAISFLSGGAALVFLLATQRWRHAPITAVLLADGVTILNLVVLIGYAYGAPLLYGGTFIPVALPTAFALVLVGVGQLSLAVPAIRVLPAWSITSVRGRLLRAFLPSLLVFILIADWLEHLLEHSMLLNPALMRSLTALAAAGLIVAITGLAARRTGADIEQAEEALRRSEENFRRSLDDSPLGIRIMRPEGGVVYANRAFLDLVGYNATEEYDAIPIEERFTPKSYAELQRRQAMRKRGEPGPSNYEVDLVRKYGRICYAEVFRREVLWNGKPHFQHLFHDITERKQAEEALRRSEDNFRRSLDDSPMGIRIVTPDGKTTYVNRAFLDLHACKTIEEFKEVPTEERYTQESYAEHQERKEKRKRGDYVPPNYEISIVRPDGEVRHLQVFRKEALWNGEPQFQLIYEDATERRKMQEQLMAQDRLASIGQLTSGVAHELNNPLTTVLGFSEVLLRKDLPDDVKKDLEIIHDGAVRTSRIVRDLLAFARRQPEAKLPVGINDSIQRVLELRAYEHRSQDIRVTTRFAPDLPPIMGNAFQLQQVFLNIIVNAEFFMVAAHRRGSLTVTTERAGDCVRACFADDGPGIPKGKIGLLFTPFFTTKEVGKGTGLGLSICHGIVTAHGGRIYAESEPGKGATFIVELPVGQAATGD